jgi:hydrogenase small subunit
MAMGTCASYGGIPAMKNNPTGAMGLRDHLGAGWRSRLGTPIVNLPGCPVAPDNITETLLYLVLQIAGTTQPIELDDQGRPAWLFERTAHEVCNRAGFADHGDYADRLGDDGRCLVKFGCKGPVVKCNVPARGWINGIGGCPNVGGICMACTMPGFPDKYLPLMDTGPKTKAIAAASRFAYGPLLKTLRTQSMKRRYDVEPPWRRPGDELVSGYTPRW